MGMYDELGHWDSYDDDRQYDPNYEEFDRVITTTKKAVLYGYKNTQFWLPKSVHSCIRAPHGIEPGEVQIEGWATYHLTTIRDTVKRNLDVSEANSALQGLDFDE